MARKFRNPANGHIEEVSAAAGVGAFFLGLFYFAFKGIWRHFIIQALVIVFFLLTMGPPGVVLAFVFWAVYAFAAPSIVAGNYLRGGWVEVPEGGEVGVNAASAGPDTVPTAPAPAVAASDERLCPFCAEPIKRAAIKCKHCGSTVEAQSPA